jgi:hypothetical protein
MSLRPGRFTERTAMHDDYPDQKSKPQGHDCVPSRADFDPPRRLEALGEGYDEHDRRLDAALTAEARQLLAGAAPPVDLADRLFETSMDAMADHQSPRGIVSPAREQGPTYAFQRLALAACMGLAVLGAWWLATSDTRLDRTQLPVRVVEGNVPEVVPLQNTDPMSAEAEWAMLASARDNHELDQLVALVTTRDMGFSDATSDLTAILDAMQNPHLQAFDLEWSR